MAVKLLVARAADAAGSAEVIFDRVFGQDAITIGRASTNLLVLPDDKQSVSRRHAEIKRTGSLYQLVDLGSRNFTYLNGERLQAEQPYDIQDGDSFRVGDFEITFMLLGSVSGQETIFEPLPDNPFKEEAAQLAGVLRSLRETYDRERPNRRADALLYALREVLDLEEAHEAVGLIASLLGAPSGHAVASADLPRPNDGSPRSSHTMPSPEMGQPGPRLERVIDTLLEAASKLMSLPRLFQYEFIRLTVMQSAETAFLYDGDAEVLRRHLLDPSIPEAEVDHRLGLLQEAAEGLVMHQMALLDGYKACVQKGAQQLLDEVDPAVMEDLLAQRSPFFKMFPFLGKGHVVRLLRQKCQELRSEGWAVAEQKVFRPAFIKAYLARMESARRHSPDAELF